MPLYRYEAVDKTGKVVRGAMDAANEQQVVRKLAAMGYSARQVYAPSAGASASRTSGPAVQAVHGRSGAVPTVLGIPVSVKSKVPTNRLAAFFRQLAVLTRSGVPLFQAFSDLSSVTRDRRLRRAIVAIQQELQLGRYLSNALAKFPDLFPAHIVASVWCGELAGKLDVALDEVATDLESEASDELYARVGWTLFKINLIFLVLTLPAYNVTNLIAPLLGSSTEDVERSRDLVRMFWGDVAHAIVHQYLPAAIGLMLAWWAWGHIKRVAAVRRLLDSFLLRMPIWGKLHRYRAVSRFAKALDMLYEAGISPLRAWEAATLVPRNSEIAARLRLAMPERVSNRSIAELVAASNVLEPEEAAMIATAERAGQLSGTLARLSAMYAERASVQKTTARAVSVSLLIASLIAMSGIALIIMVKSYFGPMLKFMGV
ncbi:MAG: type II secretion system F family protein [Armatimonadota bacterium]|nr:type II secretion system F family protein [Armatimonadota bacterium]